MTKEEEILQELREIDEKYQKLAAEHRQLKFAVTIILHYTLAGHNGAYTSEFGPATLGTLLKITGFDMKNRLIIKNGSGRDSKFKQ